MEDNIRRVIADIRPQMLEEVIENWTSRLDYIRASRGSYMPEIIFKMRKTDFFPEEDTTKSYSGLVPTRLQAEGHHLAGRLYRRF
ncbi:hypothetical protein TNCV_2101531 [Trichonephila clavipes]|nr:hypothetical protein TNCV_2101531 [Trichonephila clavipes]